MATQEIKTEFRYRVGQLDIIFCDQSHPRGIMPRDQEFPVESLLARQGGLLPNVVGIYQYTVPANGNSQERRKFMEINDKMNMAYASLLDPVGLFSPAHPNLIYIALKPDSLHIRALQRVLLNFDPMGRVAHTEKQRSLPDFKQKNISGLKNSMEKYGQLMGDLKDPTASELDEGLEGIEPLNAVLREQFAPFGMTVSEWHYINTIKVMELARARGLD